MTEQREALEYVAADVTTIQGTLRELFSQEGPDEKPKVRVGNANFLLLTDSQSVAGAEEIIRSLSLVHPCRFFLIQPTDSGASIDVEVATRCHVGQNHHFLCSEVVSLVVPRTQLAALPSVLFAHLLTGMPTELTILAKEPAAGFFEAILPIADTVIFDSSLMAADATFFAAVSGPGRKVVDLSWLRTAVWREQVREIFRRPMMRNQSGAFKQIDIVRSTPAIVPGSERVHSGPYLIGAWILQSFGLEVVGKAEADALEVVCTGGSRGLMSFPLHGQPSSRPDGIEAIRLCLDGVCEGQGEVQVQRSGDSPARLEGVVSMSQCLRLTSTTKGQSDGALLARWYSGAISCAYYHDTLVLARSLYGLLNGTV